MTKRYSRGAMLSTCVLVLGTVFSIAGCPSDKNGDAADGGSGGSAGTGGDEKDAAVSSLEPGQGIPGILPADSEEPCNLHTKFTGDENCIAPPKAGTGIQIHVGPSNYDDPKEVAKYLIQPGEERTECFYIKTPNDKNEFYFPRKFRMRPGSHHMISNFLGVSQSSSSADVPDGWGPCNQGDRIGSFGGAEKSKVDYPTAGKIAPENVGFGKILPTHTQLSLELHHINTTDKPILREAWLNIYWKPKSEIKTWVQDMFTLGGLSMNVPPGAKQIYHNKCVMQGHANIVDIFGHFHAHTQRFSAWRTRAGDKKLVYEVYDWHDTPTYAYDTVTKNREPDPVLKMSGASSGTLDLQTGDLIEWECEINNDSDVTLKYRNELQTGEMCNLFGTYTGDGKTLTTCRDPGVITNL